MAAPTFEQVGHFADQGGATVIRVPLRADFSHDLDGMLSKVGDDTGLVYICNPNNPTASLTLRSDLDAFIAKLPVQARVLVDEAYHHFAMGSGDYKSMLEPVIENDKVIVCRTFSKIYGLAGMRLGYAVASVAAVDQMRRFVTPENVNVAVLRGGVVGVEDDSSLASSARRNAVDRAEFMRQAQARRLSPIPSYANFAMMDVGRPVEGVIADFKQRGIFVGRRFEPLNSHLRISFGLPEEMKKFWRAWDSLAKT